MTIKQAGRPPKEGNPKTLNLYLTQFTRDKIAELAAGNEISRSEVIERVVRDLTYKPYQAK